MITREDAVEFFQELVPEGAAPSVKEAVKQLPPYLCYVLINGGTISGDISGDLSTFFRVGHSENGKYYHSLYCSPSGFRPDVQVALPLEGHEPLRAIGVFEWITLSLDELLDLHPESWQYIQQWCSVVIWVRRDPILQNGTELTSTSLPTLPFATFISKKAIRHVPPKFIIPEVTFYGLQENLLHEALHQQLTAFLIAKKVLTNSPKSGPQIDIPWRRVQWPLDRAFHAAWVYQGILKLRKVRLMRPTRSSTFDQSIRVCYDEGRHALDYLCSALRSNLSGFADCGKAAVERLLFLQGQSE